MAGQQYIGTGRIGAHKGVAFSGTAGTIAHAIGTGVTKVRVVVTSSAYIKVDNNPPATTADVYLPAERPEYFSITPGQRVSAVQVSAGGTLHVTEIV